MTDDLQQLKGVGSATADKLNDSGFESFEKIAVSSPKTISEKASIGETKARDLIQKAKKESDIGGFESAENILERRKEIDRVSFLHDEIDRLFGDIGDSTTTGIQTQAITEFYGKFGSGKSQLTHQLCVNVQLPEEVGGVHGRPIFIDTEDSFRPGRVEDMIRGLPEDVLEITMEHEGVEDVDELVENMMGRILCAPAENSSHQLLLGEEVDKEASKYEDSDYPVKILIVDSIMGNLRAEYTGRAELSSRQRKLNKHISDLIQFAKLNNAAVVIANQIVSDPNQSWGPGTKPVGGNILGHNSTYRVKIRKSKKNKRTLKMMDAPDLPEREIVIRITDEGIKPE